MKYDSLDDFLNLYSDIDMAEHHVLPLCAAENLASDFVKIPHSSFLQEKYVLGGVIEYLPDSNFHGSDKLFKIYTALQNQCRKAFNCKYADARTLSGLNAIITILMALFDIGDTILVTAPEYGGHSSIPVICNRLGLKTEFLPYDYNAKDFDYFAVNHIIEQKGVKGILIALSDMIEHPRLDRIKLNNTILIYDATQVLGLIATQYMENPFNWFSDEDNFILMGATHKTIPGPTCGLIMTRNMTLARRFDVKINPDYLRNVQLNNVVSLLFALFELELFGNDYFQVMNKLINVIASKLEKNNIKTIRTHDNQYSKTHQLWLSMNERELKMFEKNALLADVSLNVRKRKIYETQGVRLGFQQIARFNWGEQAASLVADILLQLNHKKYNYAKIAKYLQALPPKKLHFTFDRSTVDKVKGILHNSDIY